MEFRQLQYFLAIAEEGSINRAADRLLVSQPSLSRQLHSLERQLGHSLVSRTARGISLTPAGHALLQHARRILALEAATPEVLAEGLPAREVVSIGVPPGTPADWLVGLVRELKEGESACAPTLIEANSSVQLRMLREGRLDLAMVHQQPPSEYSSWRIGQESFGLAVRPNSPLAAQAVLTVGSLDSLRVLVHSRDQVPTQQEGLIRAALDAGVQPKWQFAQFVEHALASAEAADADAVLVSRYTAERQLPGWVWHPISALPIEMTTWLVSQPRTRAAVEAAAAVVVGYEKRKVSRGAASGEGQKVRQDSVPVR
ncbi:LysR family transcriptional regulator [Sinomonas gamaensis]|uniref:LysR family transcriptional regulator n=1 Tax=Sinomonas gamaensis TaxID=2565624 RepID=UPI0011099648|nr:LysR family transcriptional regulator [Sinomonas gamaensis]